MSASCSLILLYLAWLKNSWIERLLASYECQWIEFGSRLITNFRMYTNNFRFGYVTAFCFFETFAVGWWVLWLENLLIKTSFQSFLTLTWTWAFDFDVGFGNTTYNINY